MKKRDVRQTVVPITLVALSLSLLAGCGSGDKSTSTTAKPNTENKTASENKAATDTKSKTAEVQMRIGLTLNEQSVSYKSAVKFKESVEKYSNSSISVQVFPSSQLGGELSMTQQVQSGALESTVSSSAPLGNIVPEISLFDLPFLFKDENVGHKVIGGPVGQKILDKFPEIQMYGLTYWENGFRDLTNSKGPIKTLDDLKGLKIRVMENPMQLDFWRALGANPTPMSFDQVFNALQQKVIDGQENPIPTIYTSKLYEAQKYLTYTHHVYSPHVFLVNKAWFDKLSKDQQEAIKKAANDSREFNLKLNSEELNKDVEALKQKGVEFNPLSDDVRQQIQEKVKPVIEKYTQKYPELAKELFDEIKKAESSK